MAAVAGAPPPEVSPVDPCSDFEVKWIDNGVRKAQKVRGRKWSSDQFDGAPERIQEFLKEFPSHIRVDEIIVKERSFAPPPIAKSIRFFPIETIDKIASIARKHFHTNICTCEEDDLEFVVNAFRKGTDTLCTVIYAEEGFSHIAALTLKKCDKEVFAFQFDSLGFTTPQFFSSNGLDEECGCANELSIQSDGGSCSLFALDFAVQSQLHLADLSAAETAALVRKIQKDEHYPSEWVPGVHKIDMDDTDRDNELVFDLRSKTTTKLGILKKEALLTVERIEKVAIDAFCKKKGIREGYVGNITSETTWNGYTYYLGEAWEKLLLEEVTPPPPTPDGS